MAFNSRRVDLSKKGVDDILDELTTEHVVASTLGKVLDDLRQRIPGSGTIATTTSAVGSVTGAVGSVTASVTVGTNNDKTGYALSATGIDSIWDELDTGHNIADSMGQTMQRLSARLPGSGTIATTVSAVGSVTGAVGSVTASVTVGTNNDKTGYALSAAGIDSIWDEPDAGHTTVNTPGNALRLLDNVLPGSTIAAASDIPTERGTDNAALASVCTEVRLAELAAANLPTDIDAILADVTGIAGAAMRGTDSAALASNYTSGRATNLDNLNATVSSRATPAQVNTEVDTGLLDFRPTQSASSGWISASSPSTIDAFGSYVQLFASTGFVVKHIVISIIPTSSAADKEARFSIASGAATSESDKINDMGYKSADSAAKGDYAHNTFNFPFAFASSLRLSIRVRDDFNSVHTYKFCVVILG